MKSKLDNRSFAVNYGLLNYTLYCFNGIQYSINPTSFRRIHRAQFYAQYITDDICVSFISVLVQLFIDSPTNPIENAWVQTTRRRQITEETWFRRLGTSFFLNTVSDLFVKRKKRNRKTFFRVRVFSLYYFSNKVPSFSWFDCFFCL